MKDPVKELKSLIKEHVLNEVGDFDPNDPINQVKLYNDPKVRHGKEWAEKGGNFPIERNGKIYYVSRSVAVSLCVFCQDKRGRWCLLINQRGPSAEGAGLWNTPCGFLDYGEDAKTAAKRETWEETGVAIPNDAEIRFLGANTGRIHGTAQTVSMAFTCVIKGTIDDYPVSAANAEPGEVSDIQWMPILDGEGRVFNNYKAYQWRQNIKSIIGRAQTALLPYIKMSYKDSQYDELVKKLTKEIKENPTALFLLNKILKMKK